MTGGAGQMEELPGRLKYLEQPFESCVKDLRSQVEIFGFRLIFLYTDVCW